MTVRSPRILTEGLNRKLNAYTLAAGAAGVTVLGSSLPAECEAVCMNTNVVVYGGSTSQIFFPGQRIPAFNLAQTFTTGSSLTSAFKNRGFLIANTQGASVVVAGNGYPADLSTAAVVGPNANFGKGNSYGLLFTYSYSTRKGGRGNFTGGANYVGMKFQLDGQTHYGWARMKVTRKKIRDFDKVTTIHLQAVGYETVAGQPVQVNANCKATAAMNDNESDKSRTSAALGSLALGADGIAIWRQK